MWMPVATVSLLCQLAVQLAVLLGALDCFWMINMQTSVDISVTQQNVHDITSELLFLHIVLVILIHFECF